MELQPKINAPGKTERKVLQHWKIIYKTNHTSWCIITRISIYKKKPQHIIPENVLERNTTMKLTWVAFPFQHHIMDSKQNTLAKSPIILTRDTRPQYICFSISKPIRSTHRYNSMIKEKLLKSKKQYVVHRGCDLD